jgi:hypothetical protein
MNLDELLAALSREGFELPYAARARDCADVEQLHAADEAARGDNLAALGRVLGVLPEGQAAGLRGRTAGALREWALMYPIPAWRLAEGDGAERLADNWARVASGMVVEAIGDAG